MSVDPTNPSADKTTELQSKLHQAAQREPHRRFHALYDKLHLPYVLQRAWELVRQNRGSAGIDRQTLAEIEAQGVPLFLEELARNLRAKTYRPLPVRRVNIPKGPGAKTRPLGIPTIRDRVVQAAAKLLLEPIFEADFVGTSYGFRPGIGQLEALAAVTQNSRAGYRWVVDGDIEQFFDTLDHQRLMAALRRRISDGELLRLIYRWLKAGYLEDGEYHDTDQGSPQGGVLSPLLANVYLHELDQAQQTQKSFLGRLVRFADDFVIQCGTREHAEQALRWVREQLEGLGLRLHPEKTRLILDREGFDFLGFHHQRLRLRTTHRESRGLLRWPSQKARRKFREQIRQKLGPPGRTRAEWSEIQRDLRQYLTGWVQYYRHGESSRVLHQLDRFVEERVARNMARSQPKQKRSRRPGEKRKQLNWLGWLDMLRQEGSLPKLAELVRSGFRKRRGRADVRWRAG